MPRRVKPIIHRKNTTAFVDEVSENSTAICNHCFENDIETILVSYPKDPSHFMQCPHCHTIVNHSYAKHKSSTHVLGKVEGMSSPTFEVIETRRRFTRPPSGQEQQFDPNDYPMTENGQPDSDLAYYNTVGQITRIVDDDVGEEEFEL